MSNGSINNLWLVTIEPSRFPLAGKWLLAQQPNNDFPTSGWFFMFQSSGSPEDSTFSATIGENNYTFNVETRDRDTVSGTVTTPGQDDGTWSAQGQSGGGGPDL